MSMFDDYKRMVTEPTIAGLEETARRHRSKIMKLEAEITRLRADREAVIRECGNAVLAEQLSESLTDPSDIGYRSAIVDAHRAILALLTKPPAQ